MTPAAQARVPVLLAAAKWRCVPGVTEDLKARCYRGPAAAVNSGEGAVRVRSGRLPGIAGASREGCSGRPAILAGFPEARESGKE